jgi:acetyl esterase/lipase
MSWQSALASWFLRRKFRPETAKPGINVARARAFTSKRVWSPKVPPGWLLSECYAPGDTPLRGEWLSPSTSAGRTILYFHGGGYYFCTP